METKPDILAPQTTMSAVTLKVADLDVMTDFYQRGVGLTLLSQKGGRAALGRGAAPMVVLEHTPSLRHAPAGHAGLFHTAILFNRRSDLAAAVYSVATRFTTAFTGSSDHLVSQAFYFDDPEGNGVELYWDRPRDQWRWDGDHIRMDTVHLDPNRFLGENLADPGQAAAIGDAPLGVGHVHLKVGDIATAHLFYVETLGFEETAALGNQALFVSAGRYHHHVAMNTWQSRNAGPRTPALGLGQVSVEVPTADEVAAVAQRLRDRGVQYRHDGAVLTVDDPWRNLVRVSAPTA
ncbi:VOC family protein [Actinorugispora endophytica]|nr:VOC family protein [Actinorugispora endophytica]